MVRSLVEGVDIDDAVTLLGECGSDWDPIIHRGKDTTPQDLLYSLPGMRPFKMRSGIPKASQALIEFYGGPQKKIGHKVSGSLFSMVLDRIEMQRLTPMQVAEILDGCYAECRDKRSEAEALYDRAR